MKKVSAVILDLGGVVFDLDWRKAIHSLEVEGFQKPTDFADWLGSWVTYDLFERGKMEEKEFFEAFQKECRVSQPVASLRDAFNSLIVGPVSGVENFLASLKNTPVFALSNTNATHYDHLQGQYKGVMGQFERVFTSHQMGLRKPEKEIFEEVVKAVKLPHSQVLFIDDSMTHVNAAREVGLCAEQCVSSVQKLTELMGQYGCEFGHLKF